MRAFVIVAGSVLVGCTESYEFTVEMRHEGQRMRREVTCLQHKDGQTRNSFPGDIVQRIDALYETGPAQGAAAGVFEQRLPGEFGGSGFHQAYSSDLGMASIYSERVQANRSAWEVIEKIDASVDRSVNLLLGWFRWQLTDVPEFADLADELDSSLRRELKDLAVTLSFPRETASEQGLDEWGEFFLALHRVLETELFDLAELPELYGTNRLLDDDVETAAWFLGKLRDVLADRLEVPAEHRAFSFLDDTASFVASWRAWIANGGGQDVSDPPDGDSDPGEALDSLLDWAGLGFEITFGDGGRTVATRLATGVEPLLTNGTFDARAAVVTWPGRKLAEERTRPLYRYAVWATPDEEAQQRILGSVTLTGADLFEYALWYEGLDAERLREWTALLAGLDPGRDLDEQLAGARFRVRPEDQRPDPHRDPGDPVVLVPYGAEILRKALKKTD